MTRHSHSEQVVLKDAIAPLIKVKTDDIAIDYSTESCTVTADYSVSIHIPTAYSRTLLKKVAEQILDMFKKEDCVYIEYLYDYDSLYSVIHDKHGTVEAVKFEEGGAV